MNILGIGGYELLIIILIGIFVVGPKRVGEMVHQLRRVYTELKQKREDITAMVSEELEIEEIKKEAQMDVMSSDVRKMKEDLSLDTTLKKDLQPMQSSLQPQRFTLGNLIQPKDQENLDQDNKPKISEDDSQSKVKNNSKRLKKQGRV